MMWSKMRTWDPFEFKFNASVMLTETVVLTLLGLQIVCHHIVREVNDKKLKKFIKMEEKKRREEEIEVRKEKSR